MTRTSVAVVGVAIAIAAPAAASARWNSLYSGPGQRPGPDLLYAKPAVSPQLSNRSPWKASPILVSGTTAYRKGEFLYQDYLYDDTGAHLTVDPNDPRTAGNLFSKPNGTYTYPTDKRYANNAADLVELRVKPLRTATAFRVTLNTLKDPSLVAFSIAIGGKRGVLRSFPHGANVRAPADLFLTVHPSGSHLVADLVRAATGRTVPGAAPVVFLDRRRRQIGVRVSHRLWNPKQHTVRLAAGVGLWDKAGKRYLVPQASASSSTPGGAAGAGTPAAFFNVAFRRHEPVQHPTEGSAVVLNAAWWRDRAQGNALAAGDISQFFANASFRKLARHAHDDSAVPRTGPMDRIEATHFELSQGADFGPACLTAAADCPGQYQGRLQPYAIYIPRKARPASGYGLTLLLHSLSAMYNQYLGTRNMTQLGERGPGSIVITTESRGPDEGYENYGAADVFDAWADVARRFRLDPAWTTISGYSMGGIGTFKLGAQFPDLFAKAQPVVGDEGNSDVLASLRNVPVLMWNNHGDELVNETSFEKTANALDSLGYRYETDAYQPCANPNCSPLFPNHLQLAINDWFAPAAAFLGTTKVDRNPAHVTFAVDAARNHAKIGIVGNHAYWASGLKLRDPNQNGPGGDPIATIDAISRGFGSIDPVSASGVGAGTLSGGNFGTLAFTRQYRTWGPPLPGPKLDQIDLTATNLATATINVQRARVDCQVKVNITTDGPLTVTLPGCGRTIHAG